MSFDQIHANCTSEDKEFYDKNGYIVIQNCFSPNEVDQVKQEVVKICKGEYGQIKGLEPVPVGCLIQLNPIVIVIII